MYIPVIVVEKRNKHNDLHTTNVRIPGVYDKMEEARLMGSQFINSYLFDLMKSDEFIKSGAGTEKDNRTGQECVISIVEFEHTVIEIRLFIMAD